jgi:peptidoglycan/xylan/chitin deacetylase (PgdA/CDA1 family)
MQGLLRAALVATVSLAAGSWVSLGRPELRLPRIVRSEEHAPPAPAPLPPDPPALPQETDPSLVPSFAPWPRTNPEASITKAWMVAEGPAKRPGQAKRLVTLTFDDGPTPETTPAVLKLLAKHRVHATFFVIGGYLDGNSGRAKQVRRVLQRVVRAGHLVGNHTHDHANLTALPRPDVIAQIDRGAASIERVIGTRPILFRPPYGRLDDFGEQLARDRNLEVLLWSVEAQDMQRGDPDEMFHDLVAQLDYKEGGIVLLHDVKRTTLPVLKRLLAFLRDRPYDPAHPDKWGYEIVDLPTYLRAVAASPQPVARRDDLEAARGSGRPSG